MLQRLSQLEFPRTEPPAAGEVVEIAPGILWLRLRLPYALDHVNLYLFEDGDGWALFDTGLGDDASREAWERVLTGPLGGRPITRLVVSHFHPDHAGLAGWFHERFAPPLHMAATEYLTVRLLQQPRSDQGEAAEGAHFRARGLDEATVEALLGRGLSYLRRTTGIAPSFERLRHGDRLALGGRTWEVLTGGGHAPEQVMLWCAHDNLFLAADQVLARISPNVSVVSLMPNADPLGDYIASLEMLRDTITPEALVLPGHNLPFRGMHLRTRELLDHHEQRCDRIAAACAPAPRTCAEIVPVLFHRPLDPHQLSFAVGEAQAHINRMVRSRRLVEDIGAGGVSLYRLA